MAGSTIDHIVAITVFIAVLLLFFGVFNQMVQTAILYQRHRYLSNRCSDLLDNILLNPGNPQNWGKSNATPTIFGLQDPESSQYRLSSMSLMRLNCPAGTSTYYSKTGLYYNYVSLGFGKSMLVPYNELVNYSKVRELLGINNTYGFQLTIAPIINVSVTENQPNPLKLAINVRGAGFPLLNANISYCFLTVKVGGAYPYYTVDIGTALTDQQGSALLNFPGVDGSQESYVLIAYAHLTGLVGMGCYEHVTCEDNYIAPLVSDFEEREIIIAHNHDLFGGSSPAEVTYNATFVLLTEDFTLREIPMENSTGKVNSGNGQPYAIITIPTDNPGILVITYRKSQNEFGVVLMPWGVSSMAFSVIFGESAFAKGWVATDIRQVVVDGVGYQAKLALWSELE